MKTMIKKISALFVLFGFLASNNVFAGKHKRKIRRENAEKAAEYDALKTISDTHVARIIRLSKEAAYYKAELKLEKKQTEETEKAFLAYKATMAARLKEAEQRACEISAMAGEDLLATNLAVQKKREEDLRLFKIDKMAMKNALAYAKSERATSDREKELLEQLAGEKTKNAKLMVAAASKKVTEYVPPTNEEKKTYMDEYLAWRNKTPSPTCSPTTSPVKTVKKPEKVDTLVLDDDKKEDEYALDFERKEDKSTSPSFVSKVYGTAKSFFGGRKKSGSDSDSSSTAFEV